MPSPPLQPLLKNLASPLDQEGGLDCVSSLIFLSLLFSFSFQICCPCFTLSNYSLFPACPLYSIYIKSVFNCSLPSPLCFTFFLLFNFDLFYCLFFFLHSDPLLLLFFSQFCILFLNLHCFFPMIRGIQTFPLKTDTLVANTKTIKTFCWDKTKHFTFH